MVYGILSGNKLRLSEIARSLTSFFCSDFNSSSCDCFFSSFNSAFKAPFLFKNNSYSFVINFSHNYRSSAFHLRKLYTNQEVEWDYVENKSSIWNTNVEKGKAKIDSGFLA